MRSWVKLRIKDEGDIQIMVSIIIINFDVKKELFACIESIIESKSRVSYEIIVVDNDEKKNIGKELHKRFPKVIYIENDNKGFGEGNNVGAKKAKGEYLFFLNPDTTVFPQVLDNLMNFFKKYKKVGIVAPLLHDNQGKAYQQGTRELTPIRGIFALSFINKLFPKNQISQKYWLHDWDRKSLKEVDVVPGTAFMIRKEIFEKVGGFDENFFLYFEEFDLCKRVKELGWKICITPTAKVTHAWGSSTKKSSKNIQQIFEQSRLSYFRKHFGLVSALSLEAILRFGKYEALLTAILLIGAFLRIHNIHASMPFIGDQGWFYLSARDMLLTGDTPLVGIASSHPWLHQGAFWTYLLGVGFWIFGFSPFIGVYISIVIGLLAVGVIYRLGSGMFSKSVGLLSAALMATSPLVIAMDRMPYHTSPIPLFTILFMYCLYRWVKGNVRFFPLVILFLAILYNFELATALLGIAVIAIWLYGFIAKKNWARNIINRKSLLLSLIAFAIPMLPMIIYDFGHGFPQTLGFVAWLGYKVLVMLGYPPLHPSTPVTWSEMIHFFIEFIRKLLFGLNGFAAFGIFAVASLILLRRILWNDRKDSVVLLLFLNAVLVLGLFAVKTPSDAYLPMMFPGIILLLAVSLYGVMRLYKTASFRLLVFIGVFGIIFSNSYYAFERNRVSVSFTKQLEASKYIVKEAEGKEYNLKGRGAGSQFESFTMNYAYLTWWMGHGPSRERQKLEFVISEEKGIKVEK